LSRFRNISLRLEYQLRNFLTMSFKNNTSQTERGLSNTLKCAPFTLNISSCLLQKSQSMRVITFKLVFFLKNNTVSYRQKIYIFLLNPRFLLLILTAGCSLSEQLRIDDEDNCSTFNDINISFLTNFVVFISLDHLSIITGK
jgi:hypothetical protein